MQMLYRLDISLGGVLVFSVGLVARESGTTFGPPMWVVLVQYQDSSENHLH